MKAQHNGDKDARRRKKERKKGGTRARIERKRMFGLVDRLPLQSQRAPILSADVNNGERVEAVDEGGVCVRLIKVKGNWEWREGV